MVSVITQSGIDRVTRLQIESPNPIVKTTQDKIAFVILVIGVLVLLLRYKRKKRLKKFIYVKQACQCLIYTFLSLLVFYYVFTSVPEV